MSYELISLRVAFFAQVASYFYCTSYFLHTSYCLFHELRVIFIARVTSYCLLHELRVIFCIRVKSYFLTMSNNKDKDDKMIYDKKVMINNYSLGSFFVKEPGVHLALFLCY